MNSLDIFASVSLRQAAFLAWLLAVLVMAMIRYSEVKRGDKSPDFVGEVFIMGCFLLFILGTK